MGKTGDLETTRLMTVSPVRTGLIAAVTMVAFAFNSVIARAALGQDLIDPASYTTIRMGSGALVLFAIVAFAKKERAREKAGSWYSGFLLFTYAIFLSFAYVGIDTGIGALVLFAGVQATMIGFGLYAGERPSAIAWIGNVIAIAGFVYLLSPGLSAPDPVAALLMFISGVAWGLYSVRGRGAADPVGATARNFVYCAPMTLIPLILFISSIDINPWGALLAALSGAVTSALGYILWYEALKGLTSTKAAVLQLTAPLIASFFGVILLSEPATLRLWLSAVLITGGVAMAVLARSRSA
ncbi:MAG: DMT family transporter [Pseudomonadota bacterium]